jgi:hypothetical protein
MSTRPDLSVATIAGVLSLLTAQALLAGCAKKTTPAAAAESKAAVGPTESAAIPSQTQLQAPQVPSPLAPPALPAKAESAPSAAPLHPPAPAPAPAPGPAPARARAVDGVDDVDLSGNKATRTPPAATGGASCGAGTCATDRKKK